jgi:hypothetical protein
LLEKSLLAASRIASADEKLIDYFAPKNLLRNCELARKFKNVQLEGKLKELFICLRDCLEKKD